MITSPPIDDGCWKNFFGHGSEYSYTAFDPHLEALANITCLPDAAVLWYEQDKPDLTAFQPTVTSLGPIICPNAYTTASSSVKDASSTLIFCCPTNYDVDLRYAYWPHRGCRSMFFAPDSARTVHSTEKPVPSKLGAPIFYAHTINAVPIKGWIFNDSLVENTTVVPGRKSNVEEWSSKYFEMPFVGTFFVFLLALAFTIGVIWATIHFTRKRFYILRTEKGLRLRRRPALAEDKPDDAVRDRATPNLLREGVEGGLGARLPVLPVPSTHISTGTTEVNEIELRNVGHRNSESKDDAPLVGVAMPLPWQPRPGVNSARRSGLTTSEDATLHTAEAISRPEAIHVTQQSSSQAASAA